MKKALLLLPVFIGALLSVSAVAEPRGDWEREGRSDRPHMEGRDHPRMRRGGMDRERPFPGGEESEFFRRPEESRGGGRDFMEDFDLSSDQEEALKSILKDHRDDMKDHRKSLREQKQKLMKLIQENPEDEGAIRSAAKDLGSLIEKSALEQAKMSKERNAVLEPEQREKFQRRMGQMRERRNQSRGFFGARSREHPRGERRFRDERHEDLEE